MPILQHGEVIVRQEPAKLVLRGQVQGSGVLYLTNARMVFEKQTGSGMGALMGGGSLQTAADFSLLYISNVTSAKPLIQIPLLSKNVLRIEVGGVAYEFAVQDSGSWQTGVGIEMANYRNALAQVDADRTASEHAYSESMRLAAQAREREEYERHYRLEIDKQKYAAEAAAHVARAGASSTSIQIGQVGHSNTEIRDSVLNKSQVGGTAPAASEPVCPDCKSPIQPGWKLCPACGRKLSGSCPHCAAPVQPGWKGCPACGNML